MVRLRCFVYYIPCDDHDGLFFAGFAVCFGESFEDVDDARGHGVLLRLVLFSFSLVFSSSLCCFWLGLMASEEHDICIPLERDPRKKDEEKHLSVPQVLVQNIVSVQL